MSLNYARWRELDMHLALRDMSLARRDMHLAVRDMSRAFTGDVGLEKYT